MISDLIARVRETIPPSSGDNLLGFKVDCDAFFGRAASIAKVATFTTSDPLELVRIRVTVAPAAASLQKVRQALATAWQAVAYAEFQATSLESFQEATVLRFVTVLDGALFVSGCAVATGPTYVDLVRAFEQQFARSGPVPHLPGGLPNWAR